MSQIGFLFFFLRTPIKTPAWLEYPRPSWKRFCKHSFRCHISLQRIMVDAVEFHHPEGLLLNEMPAKPKNECWIWLHLYFSSADILFNISYFPHTSTVNINNYNKRLTIISIIEIQIQCWESKINKDYFWLWNREGFVVTNGMVWGIY